MNQQTRIACEEDIMIRIGPFEQVIPDVKALNAEIWKQYNLQKCKSCGISVSDWFSICYAKLNLLLDFDVPPERMLIGKWLLDKDYDWYENLRMKEIRKKHGVWKD